MAKEKGKPLQHVLDETVEVHRHSLVLKDANIAYARLKNDPAFWDEEKAERQLWSVTLSDGQEDY